jgi:hypothetical protein
MRRGYIEAQQDVFGAYIDLLGRRGQAPGPRHGGTGRARAFLDLRRADGGYPDVDAGLVVTPSALQRACTRPSSPTGSAVRRLDLGGAAGSRPALVRVPVLPSRLTALVQATAGLDPRQRRRGLLMTVAPSTRPGASWTGC